MFSINQPLFLKKTYAFIFKSQILLGLLELGFEFGPQRIRDLAIMCP
jgi:hypothetical protein